MIYEQWMPLIRKLFVGHSARAWVVLAIAAAVGLRIPAAHLVARRPPFVFGTAAQADAAFAGLRERIEPGERIGVLLATGNDGADMAVWYSAQYALVPAVVTPVYALDCLRDRGTARCPIDKVERVAFVPRDPRALKVLDALGFFPAERVGGAYVWTTAAR